MLASQIKNPGTAAVPQPSIYMVLVAEINPKKGKKRLESDPSITLYTHLSEANKTSHINWITHKICIKSD